MRIEWSPSALDELHAIESYLKRFSEDSTKRTVSKLSRRVEQLLIFPRSGRIVPELEFEQIRGLIEAPYRILYHLHVDTIEIVGVFHGSADLLNDHGDD